MDVPRVKTIFLSMVILTSLFAFVTPFQNSFSTSSTHNDFSSDIDFRTITNETPASAVPDATISLNATEYSTGDAALVTVTDPNANVTSGIIDFVSATVSGSSLTLTETSGSSGIFTGTFTVGSQAPSVSYTPDPKNAIRAQIDLSGFAGTLTFSDEIVSDAEADGTCFYPVTGALKITGTLNVQPDISLSYANANFTGVAAGSDPLDLGMYYKQSNSTSTQQFELITPPFNSEAGFIDGASMTINSKNSGDTGFIQPLLTPSPGILAGGGWEDITDYQGEYVLGIDSGCAGGGGGGLVRPGLVVNALAGLSASLSGGGGSGPPGPTVTLGAVALHDSASERISMPDEIRELVLNHDSQTPLEPIEDIYEDFDFPLSINGKGFALGDYENTLVTQTIQPGEQTEFKVVYYTNSEIAHSELNFNLGPTRTIQTADTAVVLDGDNPPEVVDPNGNIASFAGTINNEDDLKRVATFLVTFSEDAEITNPDIVIRTWTTQLSSGDTIVYDAIEIAQPEIVQIAEDIPEPEIQTLKSQHIPIWIKNNAGWWSEELIDDSDFISGIEYLIYQEIITISESGEITNTTNEIPSWIKNNAGWWSEDLITEKEFINGLQWLISNGIIQVTET